MDGVEYYGDFNMLKAGIAYADAVTAVSPSYAREILTKQFGCGLEGILLKRERFLHGILNGADYAVWDPSVDEYLPASYSSDDLAGKAVCKAALVRDLGMHPGLAQRPLLGFIGRLYGQKGIDLLHEIMPELMALNVGVIVLGEGKREHEKRALELMERYRGRLCVRIGYTEELAHRIQAGSDIFLMPSRYEPCGLTQMYALRYGTPPVATAVGGLRDTIVPWPAEQATGFTFADSTPESFLEAVISAVRFWESEPVAWKAMTQRAMRQAFTWEKAGREYREVYRAVRQQLS